MAIGNTFGATALSSYGGFWISYALILTPSLGVTGAYTDATQVSSVLGFFLTGWFIFTFILLLCTLRSTVMFFMLFFTLDLAFLFLACSEYAKNNGAATAATGLGKAGGVFGILAAFLAWYNAFAGIADTRLVCPPPSFSPTLCLTAAASLRWALRCGSTLLTLPSPSNSLFLIPVFHFPWSEKGREARLTKSASHTV